MALAIDGSNWNAPSGEPISAQVTLSTTKADDIILLFVIASSTQTTFSVSDTAGLIWTSIGAEAAGYTVAAYWALAASALSSDTITVTMGHANNIQLVAVGVSGADTTAPFDPDPSLPSITGWGAEVTINTTNPDAMGFVGYNISASSAASGWTLIGGTTYGIVEYQQFSNAQSGLVVPPAPRAGIAFALVPGGAAPAAHPFRRNRTYLGR